MGTILKANRYRIVDNSAFEMPLPVKFVIWRADTPVCEYLVSEDEQVSYTIITKFKELMITTIHRPLDISDIYYLFSCRVFQDRTPFTYPVLERMGLEKYNVYNILRRTHGITPYDEYWIRFDGETLTYEDAQKDYEEYLITPEEQPVMPAAPAAVQSEPVKSESTADLGRILSQNKVDIAGIVAENNKPVSIAPDVSYEPERSPENNKMSESEIESLLNSCGILDNDDPEPAAETKSEEDSEPSGGKMSQEDIEKMLAAAAGTSDPAPAEPEPAPAAEAAPSGGKMSQEDIEKMLAAAAGTSEPAPAEPEPAPAAEAAPSGGKMSQEDIEKMLAAAAGTSEPAPAEPEPAPAAETAPSGGKMSLEDIEKMLAAAAGTSEPAPAEPEPAPAAEAAPSGGKMSQADIEALLNSMQEEATK